LALGQRSRCIVLAALRKLLVLWCGIRGFTVFGRWSCCCCFFARDIVCLALRRASFVVLLLGCDLLAFLRLLLFQLLELLRVLASIASISE